MDIRVNLDLLEETTTFFYIGRMVTFSNSNWEAIYKKLRKVQRKQGIVKISARGDGGTSKCPGDYV